MKITVLGAGAMGSLYGGFLAEAGNDVWLLDIWKDHVDTINEQGLFIEGISGKRFIKTIHATTTPSDIGPSDVVIVFVKSTVTDTAVREAQDLFGLNTTILTLQNGLGNIEKIASVVEKERIIAGTTAHGSTVLGAGKIKHAGSGSTIIGEIDGRSTPRIHAIAEVFNNANIATTVSNNVIGLIWDKLLVNVGINALTAITRLKNGQLIEFKETEELLELAVNEALMVARAKGLSENLITRRYVLRPTLPPIVTSVSLSLIASWQGAIITETVFGWPGLGSLFYTAILSHDAPVIIGLTVVYAYLLVITLFILDIVYGFLDPRIKVGT